jgi:hypothetical protein
LSGDNFIYVPEVSTEGIERTLAQEDGCTKGPCTSRVCIWKTPGGHGFMVPNPRTVPRVPATVLGDLRRKVRELDGQPLDP